jgi:aryl-alcohol dehydrogenase-like predicted oxidoreductase
MKTRKLGYSDLEFTTIGFGTWAIGGGGWDFSWGQQDDDESIAAIHKAIDSGINWIDTAPVYGLGHAEEVVGKAVKGMSEKPYIATKCARVWNEKQELGFDLSREGIRNEVEQSLKRLHIEVVDLLQIHWNRPDEDIEEGWSTIAELIKEGKVRYGGVSNFTAQQLERILAIHPVASLQPPYSMLVRGVEDELLPFCQKNDIGVVAYSPMYKGLLTGKFSKERMANIDPEDHRKRDPKFLPPQFELNLELVAGLEKIAAAAGKTVAQLAIAWTLRRAELTAAIVGGRRVNQIDEVAAAGDWDLTEQELAQVEELLKKRDDAVAIVPTKYKS